MAFFENLATQYPRQAYQRSYPKAAVLGQQKKKKTNFFTNIANRMGTGLKTVSEGLSKSPFYSKTGAGKTALKFGKEALVEYPARFGASATLQPEQTFQPKGFFAKFLLGKEPIQSLTKQIGEATMGMERAGFGKTSLPIATTAILGAGLLDFTGVGGEKTAAKTILNINKLDDAVTYAKKLGIADELIERFAPKIVKAKKITEAEKLITEAKSFVSKEISPLAQEARKVYRGGDVAIDITKGGDRGISVTTDKKVAERFTPPSGGVVSEAFLPSSAKILKDKQIPKALKETYLEKAKELAEVNINISKPSFNKLQNSVFDKQQKIVDYARKNGFDGVEFLFEEEIRIIKPNILTQAVKAAPKELPVFGGLKGKERGFVTSAKEALPEAQRIAGQYIPRDTNTLAIKARNLIIDDVNVAEKLVLEGTDDKAVATASELLKYYRETAEQTTNAAVKSALYDKAAQVANTIAPKLTESGRAIQAASILGRLTPEGQVKFAAREISRFNETARLGKKIPELTGQQSKFILDEMKAINEMAEGVGKAMRFKKLQDHIINLVPTPLFKKVIAVWKAGLLTGVKTQGLNFFSNLFHGTTEIVKDIPASVVDRAASLFTGQRTKVVTTRKIFEGLKDGLIKGKRYFTTGFDERNIAAKLDYKKVNFGKGVVAKTFQAYTDIVFRALGSADQPFYYGAMSRSLMDQSLAKGMNKGLKGKALKEFAENMIKAPTEEMIRYGVADATTAVFQNQTKLGEAASKIQKIPGVGEIILPFGRTPSAVAMQIVNYSPVGIAKTIISNIGKGKFDQRLFSQGIGRGLTGTGIIAIGMELYKKGMIALDYPQGDEREQELQKAEGVKNNAIKVDGKWRSPIVLGPGGNLLLIGGHFQKAVEEEGSPTAALTKGALGGMSSFLEQTFLTGIKSSVNAITDPERYAKSYLPNLVASFVPTIVSDVARSTDPKERRSEGYVQAVQKRIPVLRGKLEPQVTMLGEERERVGNPLEVMFDPSRPSPVRETLATQELRRLMDAGFRVSPTVLGDRQGYDVLSQQENTELWKLAGGIINDKLTSLFGDERYKNLSDDKKGKKVEEFVDKSKINARAGMVLQLVQGLEGDKLRDKLSELKAGKLMTREVYNKYKEIR